MSSIAITENLKETVEKLKIWLLRLVRDSAIQKLGHGFEEAGRQFSLKLKKISYAFFSAPNKFHNWKLLLGAIEGRALPPIRVSKSGVNQELGKIYLKLTLTNKIISRKIVISRVETLYPEKGLVQKYAIERRNGQVSSLMNRSQNDYKNLK